MGKVLGGSVTLVDDKTASLVFEPPKLPVIPSGLIWSEISNTKLETGVSE